LEDALHVRQRLSSLEPARLARVAWVVELLPPPQKLPVEVALGEPVTEGRGASLDVHQSRIALGGCAGIGARRAGCTDRTRSRLAPLAFASVLATTLTVLLILGALGSAAALVLYWRAAHAGLTLEVAWC